MQEILSALIHQRCADFGAQELANAAWAVAVPHISGLMSDLAREAAAYADTRQLDAQCMANTLWTFASLSWRDVPLLVAFSRARETVLGGGQ